MRTSRRRSPSSGTQQDDRRGPAPRDDDGAGALVVTIDDVERIEADHGPAGLAEVLRVAGQRIRLALRTDDFTARWGGEELVVVLRDLSLERAVEVGQRLRMAIAQTLVLHDGASLVPTCSVGAAGGDPDRVEAVIDRARLALALAKGSGGNCVRRALAADDGRTLGALAG